MRVANTPAWSGLGWSVQTLVPASLADGTTGASAAPHPDLLPGGKERRRGEGIRAHGWRRAKEGAATSGPAPCAPRNQPSPCSQGEGKGEGRESAGLVRPRQERSDTRPCPPADGPTRASAAPHPDLLPGGKERRRGEGIRAHGWCRAKDGAATSGPAPCAPRNQPSPCKHSAAGRGQGRESRIRRPGQALAGAFRHSSPPAGGWTDRRQRCPSSSPSPRRQISPPRRRNLTHALPKQPTHCPTGCFGGFGNPPYKPLSPAAPRRRHCFACRQAKRIIFRLVKIKEMSVIPLTCLNNLSIIARI